MHLTNEIVWVPNTLLHCFIDGKQYCQLIRVILQTQLPFHLVHLSFTMRCGIGLNCEVFHSKVGICPFGLWLKSVQLWMSDFNGTLKSTNIMTTWAIVEGVCCSIVPSKKYCNSLHFFCNHCRLSVWFCFKHLHLG